MTATEELDGYLRSYAAGGYPVQRVTHPRCSACGADAGFSVLLDDDEGVAVRRCAACSAAHVMLDGADFIDDAELGEATCPCGHQLFDLAVGYAIRDDGDIRWVSVGLRCQNDGQLGVYVDWKIDYGPTSHLFDLA